MKKEYSWTKKELLEARWQARRLPGWPRKKDSWLLAGLALIGIICCCSGLIRLYLLIDGFVETLLSEGLKKALENVFLWNGTRVCACFLRLLVAAAAAYFCLFRQKHKIRLRIRQNKACWLTPQTFELDEGLVKMCEGEYRTERPLNPSMTVYFSDSCIYCLQQKNGENDPIDWMLPRRIFDQEEERIFRVQLAEYCEVRKEIVKTRKQLSRWDLTALFAAIALQLFSFALLLVALQELPGRISFNFWIYSVLLCPVFLLVYLIEAIRAFWGASGSAAGKTVNLILIVLSIFLFLPYGQGADNAFGWAGMMGLILVFQLRRLWLVSRDCGRAEEGFHVSFLKAGWFFFALTLLMDGLLLLLLLIYGLSIREIHASLDQIRGLPVWQGNERLSDEVFYCSAAWIQGTVFACAGAFCLLIEGGVSAMKQRKEAVRFLLLTAGVTALFFLRMCQNLIQFLVWVVLIVGMILMIKHTLHAFGSIPEPVKRV